MVGLMKNWRVACAFCTYMPAFVHWWLKCFTNFGDYVENSNWKITLFNGLIVIAVSVVMLVGFSVLV